MAIIDRRGIAVSGASPSAADTPDVALAIKLAVRAATTANMTLAGLQTIDGVPLAAGDRVLVKNQTDAGQNGIYLASTGNWTRAVDFDSSAEIASGVIVVASAGNVGAQTTYQLVTADPIVIDTSPLTWAVVSGEAGVSGTSAATRIRVVSVNNVAIANALENDDTLNGVVLATNDLVLLAGQTAPAENGVYVVPSSGAAPRHPAFSTYDALPGTLFIVMEGTLKADTIWQCTSDRGGTMGVAAVVISEIVGGMSPQNNLSDVSSVATSRTNLGISNLRLSVSASAGALTVAIKTAVGLDATTTNPIYIPLADGTTVGLTTALSLVLTNGSTLGFTSVAAGRVWYVIFNDNGTLRLGAVNARGVNNVKSLNPAFAESSTAEGGSGGADTSGTIYTGTAVTSRHFAIVGFSTWEPGLSTAGTWTAPSSSVLWQPGIPLPGMSTGNAVSGTTTSITTFNTTSNVDTTLTASITLKSAANLVTYSWHGPASTASTTALAVLVLRRGGVVVGHSSIIRNIGGTFICNVSGMGTDFPASIGPNTYTVAGHVSTTGQDAFFVNTGGGGHDAGGVLNLSEIMG